MASICHVDDYELAEGCWNLIILVSQSYVGLLLDHVTVEDVFDFIEAKWGNYPVAIVALNVVSGDIAERQKPQFVDKDTYIGE